MGVTMVAWKDAVTVVRMVARKVFWMDGLMVAWKDELMAAWKDELMVASTAALMGE